MNHIPSFLSFLFSFDFTLFLSSTPPPSHFLLSFLRSSQVRSGQITRKLWGSSRRLTQISSGETVYDTQQHDRN